MERIHVGCESYTWEMLGKEWKGAVDDILNIIAGAGYEGVELTNTMIGPYYDKPEEFAKALEKRKLRFPSFGFVPLHRFTDQSRVSEEIKAAEKVIAFLTSFPGCRLDLAGGSVESREDLDRKFQTMCRIYNEVALLADKKKVSVDIHPHSHYGSIIETAEEYDRLMSSTDSKLVSWCPDTGHIARGGLDLLQTLSKYKERIRNFHFKDVDSKGNWKVMGAGICSFKEVLQLLEKIGYTGWVIGEEESDDAYKDQVAAVTKNRAYLKSLGY